MTEELIVSFEKEIFDRYQRPFGTDSKARRLLVQVLLKLKKSEKFLSNFSEYISYYLTYQKEVLEWMKLELQETSLKRCGASTAHTQRELHHLSSLFSFFWRLCDEGNKKI